MIKRYYQGLLSLYFSGPMTMLAVFVFAAAFADTRKPEWNLKWLIGVLAAILAVVMFFYYKNKLSVSKTLRNVKNLDEYEKGGMLDRSFILEDRMLAGIGLKVSEHSTLNIKSLTAETKGRKVILHMEGENDSFDAQAIDRGEAERFAAYLQQRNPGIVLNNIEPKGNGTLKELGANE